VATLMREVTAMVLSLERPDPALDRLIIALEQAAVALEHQTPSDLTPRVGAASAGEGRVYLDHARDVGAYNPCFPEYQIEISGDRAKGTVSFPIPFEGPPGLVHGGFLAVFFDCVVQHHNCELGVAGKTTALALRYRRPTPLQTALTFTIDRTTTEGRLRSEARLSADERVLCEASVDAIAGDRAALPEVSPRRTGS
jgi:hypothetical protein